MQSIVKHTARRVVALAAALCLWHGAAWAATHSVSTVAQLTAAVNNNAESGDTISLAAGTYTITGGGHNIPVFTLKSGVSLIGSGAASTVLTHTGNGSIFTVQSGNLVRIESLTMTSQIAWEKGAAVYANGAGVQLEMKNCVVRNSIAREGGGAVYISNGAAVQMSGCDFYGNNSQNGAALYVVNATLHIANSKIHNNNGQLGGGIYQSSGYVKVSHCEIYENKVTSGAQGGAAYLTNAAVMEMEYTNIVKNESSNGGSGFFLNGNNTLRLWNCTMAGNVNDNWAAGGIAANNPCVIEVNNSIVTGNTTVGNGDGNISENVTYDAEQSLIGNELIIDDTTHYTFTDPIVVTPSDSGQVTVTLPPNVTVVAEDGTTDTVPIVEVPNLPPTLVEVDEETGEVTIPSVGNQPIELILTMTDSVVCAGQQAAFTLRVKNLNGTVDYTIYRVVGVSRTPVGTATNNSGSASFTFIMPSAAVEKYVGKATQGDKQVLSKEKRLIVIPLATSGKIDHSRNVDN